MFLNYLNKINEYCEIGYHSRLLNERNDNGYPCSSGITVQISSNDVINNPKNEFRYLCYYFLELLRKYPIPNIQPNQTYESVFIEFRPLPHIEFLIRNMILKLNHQWSHTIICGNLNYDFMKDVCKKISDHIKIIKLDIDNLNQSTYSELLASSYFWEMFDGEKILLYQEDSCIFKENIEDFLEWDYIGAPWPLHQNDNSFGVGNGGFSLRTKKCMLEVISKISIYETKYNHSTLSFIKNCNLTVPPEDVYFSLNMIRLQIGKVARRENAFHFSSECILNENSLGGHNFWLKNDLWREQVFLNVFKTCLISSPYGLNIGGGESYLLHVAKHFILYYKCIILLCVDEKEDVKMNTIKTILGEEYIQYFLFYKFDKSIHFYKKVDYHFDMSNSKIPSLEGLSKNPSQNYFHCQFPFNLNEPIHESDKLKFYSYENIILNSPFTKKHYLQCMENKMNSSQKISIVYPPCYSYQKKNIEEYKKEELSFVMIGRIFPYNLMANNKNFDIALQCFEKISKKGYNNFSISIIGQVYDQKTLEKLKSYQINNLYFYTDCTNEKKNEILKKTKYIMNLAGMNRHLEEEAYSYEHFGISMVEGLMYRCIPISVNGGFPPYYIKDKENGFIVQSENHLYYLLQRMIQHGLRLENENPHFEEWTNQFSEESFHQSLLNVNQIKNDKLVV